MGFRSRAVPRACVRSLAGLLLLLAAACSHAAITCTTISSPGWSTSYVNGTTAAAEAPFTVNCTRGSTSDPTSVSYSVQVNNGLQARGVNNYAALGSSVLNYGLYATGCAGNRWKGNVTLSGSVSWPAGFTGNETSTQYFWACINTAQTAVASGAYTDTVTMTATYAQGSGSATLTGTIPIRIYAPASCVIRPSPGNVSIVYPAFSPSAQSASTSFGATCTTGMPYSLDISPAAAALDGVNYNVTLSGSSAAGTGSVQNYTVTVTAPAGQGGTCATPSCMATQTHTLTLSY